MGWGVGPRGSTGWGAPSTLPVVVFPRKIGAPTKAGRANSVAVESRSGIPQVGFHFLKPSINPEAEHWVHGGCAPGWDR